MKNLKDAERLAEEALKSIDNIQPAEVNEFIFNRIQNRIENSAKGYERVKLKSMHRLAAALLLIIAINIISLKYLVNKNTGYNGHQTSGIDAFSNDYNLQEKLNNY